MRTRATALGTEPFVEEAARAELARSKSAVAAVIAGFFAAAGEYADVLLGPTTLLVSGVGSGGRVFDGRLRQPGLGAKRPRGFLPDEKIPDAARAALPSTLAALSVALVYDRTVTLTGLARRGAEFAREAGAAERARVLGRVAEVGPRAFVETAFSRPVLHLASASEGGLLTPTDFNPPDDVSLPATTRTSRNNIVLEAAWADEKVTPPALALGDAISAVDARGVFAVLGYARVGKGLDIETLELVLPLAATPVERGKPRVRPGGPIACNAPFCITADENGAPFEVKINARPERRRPRALKIVRDASRWLKTSR